MRLKEHEERLNSYRPVYQVKFKFYMQRRKIIFFFIFSVFGVPILFDDSLNETEIVDDILFDKSDADLNFKISNDDMRVYLAYVSRQKVTMETEAEVMLKEYFAATRVIRPSK